MLLMAFVTLVASAQELYLRGGMNDWGAPVSWRFTSTDGVNYVLKKKTIAAGTEFVIADANWGNKAAGGHEVHNDVEVTLSEGGNNCKFLDDCTDAQIEFNNNTKKFIVRNNFNSGEEDPVIESEIYLVGGVNGWNTSDSNYKFTKTADGSSYYLNNVVFPEGEGKLEFKLLIDGSWTTCDEYPEIVFGEGKCMHSSSGSNLVLPKTGTFSFTYSHLYNLLFVTDNNEEIPPYEIPEEGEFTVYFDNSSVNWPSVYAWMWCDNHTDPVRNDKYNFSGGTWPGVEMAYDEETGYYKTSFDIDSSRNLHDGTHNLKVIFSQNGADQTKANLHLFNNAVYTKDNDKFPNGGFTGIFVNPTNTPVDPYAATIYFNAGQDYFEPSKMNKKAPKIALYAPGKVLGEAHEMTKVPGRDAMFMYKVDDVTKYIGVQFTSVNNESNTLTYEGVYPEYKKDDSGNTTSELNYEYDAANWAKFVYGTGNGYAYQSYMSYEDVEDILSNPRENIYFIGKGIGRDGDDNKGWKRDQLLSVNDEGRGWSGEGVYVRQFSNLSEEGKFKMSAIKPQDYMNGAADNEMRWWATFNLGIVGYVPGSTNVEGELTERPDESENGTVFYKLNEVEEYRNYNQYDWSFRGVDLDKDYYLVIDTKYHTTALIDFKPMPTLEGRPNANSLLKGKFVDEFGTNERTGTYLKGASNSGEARLDEYNHLAGTARINVSTGIRNSLYGHGYDVVYGIYNGNDSIAGFHGTQDAKYYRLQLTNMVAGDEAEFKIRCTYREPKDKGGLRFRSLSTSDAVEISNVEFPNFQDVNVVSKGLYNNSQGWNLVVKVQATMPEGLGNLVMYPDFKVKNSNGQTVRLLDAKHEVFTNNIFANTSLENVFTADGRHEIYSEGDYSDDAHNWTKKIAKDGVYEYDFVIEKIAPNDKKDPKKAPADLDVDFTLYASYPFLIDDSLMPTVEAFDDANTKIEDFDPFPAEPATVRRRAEGAAPRADVNYRLSMVSEATPHSVSTAKADMSGVTDAVVADEDNAEYFTLQGVRVEGELAPGIYLRRNGAMTQKVVIR